MLKLDRRTVLLGEAAKLRTRRQNDQAVTTLAFNMLEVPLTELELSGVMLNDKAASRLFVKRKGRPAEPIFAKIASSIPLDHKITGVTLRIFLGRRTLSLQNATLHHVVLEVRQGLIQVPMSVHCIPDMPESDPLLLSFIGRLGDKVDMELDCQGYGSQQDLPIESEEEESESDGDPEVDEDDEPEVSDLGRQIATAHRMRNKGAK